MPEHGGVMRRLVAHFFPPPIRTPEELGGFLCGQANYLTQRATYEFCRNTLGYFGQHMFADPRFQDQERVCRWEGFAAILADGLVLVEGLLRPVAPAPLSAMRSGLAALYAEGLAGSGSAEEFMEHGASGTADDLDLAGAGKASFGKGRIADREVRDAVGIEVSEGCQRRAKLAVFGGRRDGVEQRGPEDG